MVLMSVSPYTRNRYGCGSSQNSSCGLSTEEFVTATFTFSVSGMLVQHMTYVRNSSSCTHTFNVKQFDSANACIAINLI